MAKVKFKKPIKEVPSNEKDTKSFSYEGVAELPTLAVMGGVVWVITDSVLMGLGTAALAACCTIEVTKD